MSKQDQPSQVSTEDEPRPDDNHIVTSDINFLGGTEQTPPAKKAPPAAESDKDDPNSQKSATDDNDNAPKKKRSRTAEHRIKRLSAKLSDQSRRGDDLQAQLDTERQKREALEQSIHDSKAAKPEPKLEDFKTPQEFAKAYNTWDKDQNSKPPTKAPAKQQEPAPRKKPSTDEPEEIADFRKAGIKKFGDDFQEALSDQVPVSQMMGEYMMDQELGPDIYLHLANNPDEAKKIYDGSAYKSLKGMQALLALAEKGELDIPDEGELQFEKQGKDDDKDDDKAPPKKQAASPHKSKAPAPPGKPSESGQVVLDQPLDELSMDDYAATRNKQSKRYR